MFVWRHGARPAANRRGCRGAPCEPLSTGQYGKGKHSRSPSDANHVSPPSASP